MGIDMTEYMGILEAAAGRLTQTRRERDAGFVFEAHSMTARMCYELAFETGLLDDDGYTNGAAFAVNQQELAGLWKAYAAVPNFGGRSTVSDSDYLEILPDFIMAMREELKSRRVVPDAAALPSLGMF